jgi:hypothetical protein
VAIAINNTRLIEISQLRAERDRQLLDITNKIRFASDARNVITTTTQELVKALNLRRAQIELAQDQTPSEMVGGRSDQDPR